VGATFVNQRRFTSNDGWRHQTTAGACKGRMARSNDGRRHQRTDGAIKGLRAHAKDCVPGHPTTEIDTRFRKSTAGRDENAISRPFFNEAGATGGKEVKDNEK
jgi:hypothetical protein